MATGWWVTDLINNGETAHLAAIVFWVIASITLHELAHGWVATWQGDDTPRLSGHLTINPIVHVGWMSLVFFAITGWAWGQMPVNPHRFRSGRRGEFYVSGAGPLMNLALALVATTALGIVMAIYIKSGTQPNKNLVHFLLLGGRINVGLGLFNLIPVPPLDGSRMLATLSLTTYRWMHQPFLQTFGIFLVVVVLGQSGFGRLLWGAGERAAVWWTSVVVNILT